MRGSLDTWRLLVATVEALALVMALGATSASAATSATCAVTNTDSGRTYTRLQQAVDAAKPGANLIVKGTCVGPTVIDKDLVIEGIRTAKARSLLHGHRRGVVITVRRGATATVADVALSGGSGLIRAGGPKKPRNRPSGVENRGDLTLRGVLVRGNHGIGVVNVGTLRMKGDTAVGLNGYSDAWNLFSVGIHNTGRLVLNGTAMVRQNRGVVNEGTLVLNGGSAIHNTLYGVENSGTMTMNDSSRVSSNEIDNTGTLTMNDTSRIIGYVREGYTSGGGVRNTGTITMNDSSLIGDVVVAVSNSGTFTMNDDSRISRNGEFQYEVGPAVVNSGRLMMNGTSRINDNWIGVENSGSVILNGSSSIRDNHRMEFRVGCGAHCPPTPRLVGAGVSNKGSLTLNDASSITGNSAADNGAGVYLWESTGASLTMTGSSTISGNTTNKTGGGIYAGTGSTLIGVSCAPQTYANVYGNSPDDCYFEP